MLLAKICTQCKQNLPLDLFYRNCGTRDGRGVWCKLCEKNRDRSAYTTKYRETENYQRARIKYRSSERYHASLRKYRLLTKRAFRHKERAREKVNYAVRTGAMSRPNSCSSCGKIRKIQAHHEDYNKPLVVIWLCSPCHSKAHETRKS